ncbi:Aste57867_4618 [Aphanomyces stellatus]|uniref:Aste57867_4618 protein n=1 Tax=Aphanomyces stellatus TaxID=120398 RepID=A0A485KFP1_9STRA|nr:hypothetical protein As57867_004605 [Aphanomyces stellatus]VFT81723.1 Aste57867_4618 [Aphanomyces stellatus]
MLLCLGGAIATGVLGRPTVLSHRTNGWWLLIEAMTPDMEPTTVAKHKQWAADFQVAILAADPSAAPSSHVIADATSAEYAAVSTFDCATTQFLREVKTHYDPTNMFHMNHNILPLGDPHVQATT